MNTCSFQTLGQQHESEHNNFGKYFYSFELTWNGLFDIKPDSPKGLRDNSGTFYLKECLNEGLLLMYTMYKLLKMISKVVKN